MTKIQAIPEGYHALTPYLCVRAATTALEFYKKAFHAQEIIRLEAPDGKIRHAEILIGDSHLMLADESPEMNFRSPASFGGTPVHLHLYVEDVDTTFKQALHVGAKEIRSVKDQFYGDRVGTIQDPFGHIWHIASHKEELSSEEIQKRAAAQG